MSVLTPHGLDTGDVIQFSGSGANLHDGRTYSVIVTSPNDVAFGAEFKGQAFSGVPGTAGVNTADSTIHFSYNHNFQDGDQIKYVVPAGSTGITGLTNGTTYYVIVLDGRTIRLATYDPTVFTNHNLSPFTPAAGNQTTLTVGGTSFTEGEAVTYHAPALDNVLSKQVDVTAAPMATESPS